MTVRIITGDALTELAKLPAESVHMCVTSPPYFGLRDYGTASWNGGDHACAHTPPPEWVDKSFNANSNLAGISGQAAAGRRRWFASDGSCRCGARRVDQQLGLEATPDEYVAAMVGVFREVRRVLRSDATCWIVIGDSYAAQGGSGAGGNAARMGRAYQQRNMRPNGQYDGIKPKDLIGIPWLLAFALRADGWWLRQDIIWLKPNPMPESVQDRCTKAHEFIFLLSKSATYYYDAEAIAEPGSDNSHGALNGDPGAKARHTGNHSGPLGLVPSNGKRNKRSVWTIATAPYPEAHFATFPPALVEPCILAGSPKGGTVLDPFSGAGTTALVADRLGRSAIGIELNPAYAAMARRRLEDDAGMFSTVEAAE